MLVQAILISGESGAGKTEATKQCFNFLAEVAGSQASTLENIALSSIVQAGVAAVAAAGERGGGAVVVVVAVVVLVLVVVAVVVVTPRLSSTPIWKSPPLMVSALSWSWTGRPSVDSLFVFVQNGKELPSQTSLTPIKGQSYCEE